MEVFINMSKCLGSTWAMQPIWTTVPWTTAVPLTSHLQHYFFYLGLALERFQPLHWSGFNRYIEAVVTATSKRFEPLHGNLSTAINKHIARVLWCPYPFTNTKCFWFHLNPFFLALHYEMHTVVTNWNALQTERQKQIRRSQYCRVLIETHFTLNARRNRFIELL